ncbi:pre-mRNA-processing protein 40A [Striga asiatica]|uniref:Pre-mRNA-processing protein 40A n=1 Tax=Striga asiatica TaxID=4170 RepID=A0A5A7PMX6_STRAF|nr:pre-mRNA-processing protein 40A [Striga asiatica]
MEAYLMHGRKFDQNPYSSHHKSHIMTAKNPPNTQPPPPPLFYPRLLLPSDDIFSPNFQPPALLQTLPQPLLPVRSYPPPQPPHIFPGRPYPLRQPPLLPLPAAALRRSSSTPPAANRSINRSPNPKKEKKKLPKKSPSPCSGTAARPSPNGPASRDFRAGAKGNFGINKKNAENTNCNQVEIFSPSCVASPPPSSLPLPSFCLRHNSMVMGCNGVNDGGASDSLKQILRLK